MNIDLSTLPSVAFTSKKTLPQCCGIYFVLNEDEILYIGKTVNLLQRWKSHHKLEMIKEFENSDNFRIAWLEIENQNILEETEIALITHFKPKLNKHTNTSKSEVVRIREIHAEYIHSIANKLNISFMEALYSIIDFHKEHRKLTTKQWAANFALLQQNLNTLHKHQSNDCQSSKTN